MDGGWPFFFQHGRTGVPERWSAAPTHRKTKGGECPTVESIVLDVHRRVASGGKSRARPDVRPRAAGALGELLSGISNGEPHMLMRERERDGKTERLTL